MTDKFVEVSATLEANPIDVKADVSAAPVISASVETVMHTTLTEKDYNNIINKPRIENIELVGNKTLENFGMKPVSADDLLRILT